MLRAFPAGGSDSSRAIQHDADQWRGVAIRTDRKEDRGVAQPPNSDTVNSPTKNTKI